VATQYIDPTTYSSGATATAPTVAVISRDTFKDGLLDDLDNVFHNTAEFAEEVVYFYRSGESHTLAAVFDEEHSQMDLDTGAPVIASEPTFHCPTRQFTKEPGKGDSVRIRNREFQVISVEPDGTGVTVVVLRRD
jgi:hypothetical protein